MKQKVDIHVLCWNEMQIAPFIVDYWKRVARHVYVYDNGSTDGVVEYLSKFNWITVYHYDSDGLNDKIYLRIKNNCWKESDADWVWVSDFDEVLYSEHFQEDVEWLDNNGYTIVKPNWINCISKTNVPEYKEGELLHNLIDGGFVGSSKNIFFKPSEINEINYLPGAHTCNPSGHIKIANQLNVIHFKSLGINYQLNRNRLYRERLSETNKTHGWGVHYMFSDEKCINDFERQWKGRKPIKDLLV